MVRPPEPLTSMLGPKHWPSWLGLAGLRALNELPWKQQMQMGAAFGRQMEKRVASRRNAADVNIRICLPELSEAERAQLVTAHFENVGKALFETATCWWQSDDRLPPYDIEGWEYLEAALAKGKGVILASAHFTALEIGARMLAREVTMAPVYRQHENPVLERLMARNRTRRSKQAIPRGDVRLMMQALKENHAVWLATDQARGLRKTTGLVPFFGEPAVTVVATSRIARISGAAVIPFFTIRAADDASYRLILRPQPEGYPSKNGIADAALLNEELEAVIRQEPAQYLWMHKRFKRRGKDLPDVYRGS